MDHGTAALIADLKAEIKGLREALENIGNEDECNCGECPVGLECRDFESYGRCHKKIAKQALKERK